MELDVEVLVVDDLVGGLVLGVGVDVGGGITCNLGEIAVARGLVCHRATHGLWRRGRGTGTFVWGWEGFT